MAPTSALALDPSLPLSLGGGECESSWRCGPRVELLPPSLAVELLLGCGCGWGGGPFGGGGDVTGGTLGCGGVGGGDGGGTGRGVEALPLEFPVPLEVPLCVPPSVPLDVPLVWVPLVVPFVDGGRVSFVPLCGCHVELFHEGGGGGGRVELFHEGGGGCGGGEVELLEGGGGGGVELFDDGCGCGVGGTGFAGAGAVGVSALALARACTLASAPAALADASLWAETPSPEWAALQPRRVKERVAIVIGNRLRGRMGKLADDACGQGVFSCLETL